MQAVSPAQHGLAEAWGMAVSIRSACLIERGGGRVGGWAGDKALLPYTAGALVGAGLPCWPSCSKPRPLLRPATVPRDDRPSFQQREGFSS